MHFACWTAGYINFARFIVLFPLKMLKIVELVSWIIICFLNLASYECAMPPEGARALGDISEKCLEDFTLFRTLSSGSSGGVDTTWADYMMDSYGGVSSGVMQANYYMLGDFEECVGIQVDINLTRFHGQYCLISMRPLSSPLHVLQMGTCSPSTCSIDDLRILFGTHLNSVYNFTISQDFCQTKLTPKLDSVSLIISAIVLALFSLVIIGTLSDFYFQHEDQTENATKNKLPVWKTCLLAFSANENTKKIFGNLKGGNDLKVLHGLRAVSMSWVVVGHTYFLTLLNVSGKNPQVTMDFLRNKYASQVLITSEYAVDTFLFISGFLTSYGLLAKLHSQKTFNYLWYLIHRLLRLWPCYLFVIAVSSGPFNALVRGPMAPALKVDQSACRQQWWTHALFINIYVHYDQECLPQTWYLCLDWVYYALYPIILYPLYKKSVAGFAIYGLFLVTSFVVPGVLIYLGDLEPLPLLENTYSERMAFNEQIYETPWGRMTAGLVGLAFGYLALVKNKGLKMNPIFVSFMWTLVTVVGFVLGYSCHQYYANGTRMAIPVNVIYGIFSRPTWCLLLGWIVLACTNGYGSVISAILSWKAFVPISRLSFCTYLTHFLIIGVFFGGIKDLLYYDEALVAYITFSMFILSVLLAYILNITVEQPFTNLEKLIFH